ncbi:Transposase [Shigella dysenteriae 1617]|uniref:Transposase n=1 Tax=Shigella dysenteriae 1617 TaxID=754093 RepID=A0A0A6ZQ00_SHIDY|nr:Transposase [Shigella dysenteriae 1617]
MYNGGSFEVLSWPALTFIVLVVSLHRPTAMVKNPKGHDRFRCRDCHRVFQLTYTYEARKPGIKELITEMAFNGAGVRDTARTLKLALTPSSGL